MTDESGVFKKMTNETPKDICQVHVDADACPTGARQSIEHLSRQNQLKLFYYIDDSHELYPEYGVVRQVGKGHDAVDLALVNQIRRGDIVITQDYGLAALVLARGALAIHPKGMVYSDHNIDALLAERHLAARARKGGERSRHPGKRVREHDLQFSEQLKNLIQSRIGSD